MQELLNNIVKENLTKIKIKHCKEIGASSWWFSFWWVRVLRGDFVIYKLKLGG
jgi:hypothetical protein